MGIVASGFVHQAEIDNRLSRLQDLFHQDIERIDYRFGVDWTNDPSLFLTVHMTSVANDNERFRRFLNFFPTALLKELPSDQLGVRLYPVFMRNSGA